MTIKALMIGGAALIGTVMTGTAAQAVPYAYATNQITGLALTQTLNGSTTPLTQIASNTAQIQANANYDGFAGASNFKAGSVGTALSIDQAYSGPGPSPSSAFTAIGPGNFTGTRGNSNISAFIGATVNVNNVAEGYGTSAGGSSANNTATVTFNVLGAGQTVQLSLTDSYSLIASSSGLINEKATASTLNTFTIAAPAGTATPTITQTGADISNLSVVSQQGVPATDNNTATVNKTYTTSTLAAGVLYTLNFSSIVSETITPGIPPTPVPEPAALGLLGLGMVAMGVYRRRNQG